MEHSEWFLLGGDTRLWGIACLPVLLLVNDRFCYKGSSLLYEHKDVLHRGSPADTSMNTLHCPRKHHGETLPGEATYPNLLQIHLPILLLYQEIFYSCSLLTVSKTNTST